MRRYGPARLVCSLYVIRRDRLGHLSHSTHPHPSIHLSIHTHSHTHTHTCRPSRCRRGRSKPVNASVSVIFISVKRSAFLFVCVLCVICFWCVWGLCCILEGMGPLLIAGQCVPSVFHWFGRGDLHLFWCCFNAPKNKREKCVDCLGRARHLISIEEGSGFGCVGHQVDFL